jgi:cytochrome c biogenesis protein CcdA/HEAT repeat protein
LKFHFQLLLLLFALVSPVRGDELPDETMERFRRGNFNQPTLIEILPRYADPAQREIIRSTLLEAKEPPLQDLVMLLGHPLLAVRLGSLELLEELAGGDLSYNPWAPAGSPENAAALERWNAWAKDPVKPDTGGIFSDEQRQGYLQDILSEDADKATRARRMLEVEGLSAVGFLETFRADTPTLTPGHRARVREAQYQITLSRHLGDQSAVTARHLAFGSRDQILSALTTVREAGLLALPILRDFIQHPDPLVRESAIDSLLVTGGEPAVSTVAPLLRNESDVNVIHGALRRLKDIPGKATVDLVASFLTHPDEDLLISAIQTSLSLKGESSDGPFGSSRNQSKSASPADAAVIKALADKRWRVRAAALEYVAKRKVTAAKETSISMLDDADDFVRFAAIKAICVLGAKEALPKLKAMFIKDENMAGPVVEGYGSLNQQPDAEILARLDAVSPEARLAALRACSSNKELTTLVLHFATDENLDVACAAIRLIAGNADLMKEDRHASVIVAALRSGKPEKVEAAMERLDLPKSGRIDPRILKALDAGLANSEPTALDPLYDAFLLTGSNKEEALSTAPVLPQAQQELVRELISRTTPETPAAERFRAALILARSGHPEGFITLLKDLPNLTTAQKTAITEGLYEPSLSEAIPLLTELLRDPIPEIRRGASDAAMTNDKAAAFVSLVLTELARPGALLQPEEVYGYRFESAMRSGKLKNLARHWAVSVLDSPDAATPLKILAAISARSASSAASLRALEKYKTSPDPLLRRAAWHTIFTLRPNEIQTSAEAVAADKEAFVRVALAKSLNKDNVSWSHQFSNVVVLDDERWSHSETKPRLADAVREPLVQLASTDPSPLVRFESLFTLMTQGSSIDIDSLVSLVPQLPKEVDARDRISRWLSQNAKRATPGLAPLMTIIDPSRIDADEMKILNERLNTVKKEGFATFASLAKSATKKPGKEPALLTDEPVAESPARRESLEVIYFYKPGCPECARVKQYIQAVQDDFPLLKLHEHNILEASGTLFNQALCQRFSVPSAKQTLSPAIFTQSGFLVREDITPQSLADLFAKTMASSQDDSWRKIGEEETVAAGEVVGRRYAAFTLPVVIGAGLLDGINPCAFATIIFFLSYLQIARRTPREMLMVGAAFISAVFIAYLAAGLLLYQSLAVLNDRFAGIQKWLNLGFAGLALLAAALSFLDAWRARGGRLDEMTLQLPGFLKNRIRGVIRTGARARNFVIAAFVSGIVISLLELACTGQVYAPIIYQIQQGRLDAVLWLVIYNIAFIIPLVVIFLLSYFGLRSESLVAFQKRHTSSVKVGLGILFVVLAIIILFGQKLLAPG